MLFPRFRIVSEQGQRPAVPCSEVMLPVLEQVLHNFRIADNTPGMHQARTTLLRVARYATK
jgi:hypothetical protein